MTSTDAIAGAADQQTAQVSQSDTPVADATPDERAPVDAEAADATPDEPDPADDQDDQDDDGHDDDDQDDDDGSGAIARLRRRIARYRTRAREAEQYAEQVARELWTERVAALGLLADPADLPYDPDALHDPDAIRERAEELLQQRPHLRSRRIPGHVGQRLQPGEPAVSLASILRAGA